METMRQDNDILRHQFCCQQGGRTSTHVAREISRCKNKEYKKQNLLYGCFRKRERERELEGEDTE